MKNAQQVEIFMKLLLQLTDACSTIEGLASKRPNDSVNKFKLLFFNGLLTSVNEILPQSYWPKSDFSQFEEDTMPSNSDVMMMLSQYLACMRKFGTDNTRYEGYSHYWFINGKISGMSVDMEKLKG